jgi:putative aminopeptidase FrvX
MAVSWKLPRGCRGTDWRAAKLRPTAEEALRRLLPLPTAPYAEALPAAEVQAYAEERGWRVRADAAGNLVVSVPSRDGSHAKPSIAFEAHLDHPAMVVGGLREDGLVEAEFFGGHPPERMKGGRVRLTAPDGRRGGRARVVEAGAKDPRSGAVPLLLRREKGAPGTPSAGWLGTWDFPFRLTKRTVSNTVCDDLAGAATLLAGLDLAARSGLDRPVLGYFTRCEENGFVGCLEGIHLGSFPRRVPVVVLECSPKLPHAQPGDGPICRVGDRLSIYDPELVARLEDAARCLANEVPGFRWQRKLMDGGACEATAYCDAGYRSAGLAVALSGYHNVPDDRRQRGQVAESIDRDDQENLVLWLATLALGRKANARPIGQELAGTTASLDRLRRARAPRLHR